MTRRRGRMGKPRTRERRGGRRGISSDFNPCLRRPRGRGADALGSAGRGSAAAVAHRGARVGVVPRRARRELPRRFNAGTRGPPPGNPASSGTCRIESELEINDFPQHARWKVTHKLTRSRKSRRTDAAIIHQGAVLPSREDARVPGSGSSTSSSRRPRRGAYKAWRNRKSRRSSRPPARTMLIGQFHAKYKV